MSNSLINSLNKMSNETLTENGAFSYKSSTSAFVDLFYNAGVLERKNIMDSKVNKIVDQFESALSQDKIKALAIMSYTRDIRNGIGLRLYFRQCIKHLLEREISVDSASNHIKYLYVMVSSGVGYWDDWFHLFEWSLKNKHYTKKFFAEITEKEFTSGDNNLFLKWYPRSGLVWEYMRKYLDLSPKQIRAVLTKYKTTETLLCAGKFSQIKYDNVPSKAFKKYMSSFQKRDGERFREFLSEVKSGTKKINAGAIYPHEVLQNRYDNSQAEAINIMWSQLPDLIKSEASFLPVIDTSGSMNGLPEDIAISLGIYLAERNKSVFKDNVLTFSNDVHWINIGNLNNVVDKFRKIEKESEVADTNFEAIFKLLLSTAVKNNVSQSDMPSHLICLTDSEFNQMVSNPNNTETIQQFYTKEFEKYGYKLPMIVYWNLRVTDTVPALKNEKCLLLGGSSPNVIKSALEFTSTEEFLNKILAPYVRVIENIYY